MVHKAWAFFRRDMQTQASYRLDFLMRVTGMLISVTMFYFISQILGGAVNPYLQRYGTDYFGFVLMGMAFYPFLDLATNRLPQVLQEYQQSGTLEMLFMSPTHIVPALAMSSLWQYCWAMLEAFFYLLMATLVFGAQLHWRGLLGVIVVICLSILANAGLGLINGSFVLVTKRASPLARVLTLVTGLLAGVYYPIEVLPGWLRSFGLLLPATHAFAALRQVMLKGASLEQIGPELLALVAFTVVLLPIGLVCFVYAVRWARMDGSLSQY